MSGEISLQAGSGIGAECARGVGASLTSRDGGRTALSPSALLGCLAGSCPRSPPLVPEPHRSLPYSIQFLPQQPLVWALSRPTLGVESSLGSEQRESPRPPQPCPRAPLSESVFSPLAPTPPPSTSKGRHLHKGERKGNTQAHIRFCGIRSLFWDQGRITHSPAARGLGHRDAESPHPHPAQTPPPGGGIRVSGVQSAYANETGVVGRSPRRPRGSSPQVGAKSEGKGIGSGEASLGDVGLSLRTDGLPDSRDTKGEVFINKNCFKLSL
uniref:uncharacterized protein LOC128931987 n=1 Tax=Callithrix jacchus TaxID=9483 RepID=UPI0023DD37E7|nr:uncharacterized protein LOC128931987 [Callithrix jacchus]